MKKLLSILQISIVLMCQYICAGYPNFYNPRLWPKSEQPTYISSWRPERMHKRPEKVMADTKPNDWLENPIIRELIIKKVIVTGWGTEHVQPMTQENWQEIEAVADKLYSQE